MYLRKRTIKNQIQNNGFSYVSGRIIIRQCHETLSDRLINSTRYYSANRMNWFLVEEMGLGFHVHYFHVSLKLYFPKLNLLYYVD